MARDILQSGKTPQGRPMRCLPKSLPPFKFSGALSNARPIRLGETDYNFENKMKGRFVGPMPPSLFIEKFLHNADLPEWPNDDSAWARVYNPFVIMKKSAMYEPFIEAVAAYTPGMKFFDTHKHPDNDAYGYAPDISAYDEDDLPDLTRRTDFSKMSLFLEFKTSPNEDPFEDPPKKFNKETFHFEKESDESKIFRSQIGRYSASISGTQFRVHVFSVLICGSRARFIRWDRAGAVVSQSFDYLQSPDILASFFWYYSHASRRDRGHDPSVSKPSEEEADTAKDAFLQQKGLSYDKFLKVMIPDRENPTVEQPVLIPLPLEYLCTSPFARATRPTLAYDPIGKRLVFMKDYWRPKDNHKEGDIYARLRNHGVRHIAPFGAGNDVRDHATITAKFAKEEWSCIPSPADDAKPIIPELVQYRMILLALGRTLNEYDCTRQFVGAVRDAMEAHDDAYFKAKVLHRDISVGNILITETGGLLIDWDVSVMMDFPPQKMERKGTWPFMSVNILQDPDATHGIEDDREAAFWLILWIALNTRYSHRVSEGRNAEALLRMLDYSFYGSDGQARGGDPKMIYLFKRCPVSFDSLPHLDALIEELRKTIRFRYSSSEMVDPEVAESKTNRLRDEGWLVKIIQKHLCMDQWPTNDAPLSSDQVAIGNKRAAETELERD